MIQINGLTPAIRQRNIENAIRAKNPMENISNYKHYCGNDIDMSQHEYTLHCYRKADVEPKILKWAFKLAERNVGGLYSQLRMGWQPKIKQSELNKTWARYLIAFNSQKVPVGYAMFRFDLDCSFSVLYCYELQVESESRRQGLGRFMMNVLEQCSRYWKMEKIILTVLKNNQDARRFFETLGFRLDSSTPGISEKAEYEILSKTTYK